MSLKIEIMTDERLRAEILDLVREQVRPVIEGLLKDSAPLQAVVAETVGKLAARPEIVREYQQEIAREIRTSSLIAAREEATKRARELTEEMRRNIRSVFDEQEARLVERMRGGR